MAVTVKQGLLTVKLEHQLTLNGVSLSTPLDKLVRVLTQSYANSTASNEFNNLHHRRATLACATSVTFNWAPTTSGGAGSGVSNAFNEALSFTSVKMCLVVNTSDIAVTGGHSATSAALEVGTSVASAWGIWKHRIDLGGFVVYNSPLSGQPVSTNAKLFSLSNNAQIEGQFDLIVGGVTS